MGMFTVIRDTYALKESSTPQIGVPPEKKLIPKGTGVFGERTGDFGNAGYIRTNLRNQGFWLIPVNDTSPGFTPSQETIDAISTPYNPNNTNNPLQGKPRVIQPQCITAPCPPYVENTTTTPKTTQKNKKIILFTGITLAGAVTGGFISMFRKNKIDWKYALIGGLLGAAGGYFATQNISAQGQVGFHNAIGNPSAEDIATIKKKYGNRVWTPCDTYCAHCVANGGKCTSEGPGGCTCYLLDQAIERKP